MSLARTAEGKVVLYAASTGERFVRWPVDAREMLASGQYTSVPPKDSAADSSAALDLTTPHGSESSDTDTNTPIADPVPHVTAALALVDAQSPTGAPLVLAPPDAPAPVTAPMAFPGSADRTTRRKR